MTIPKKPTVVIETVTGDVTLQPNTNLVFVNTTAARTIDLPTAGTTAGKSIDFIDISGLIGVNSIVLTTQGAETIDGAASVTLTEECTLVSDGSNWFIKE